MLCKLYIIIICRFYFSYILIIYNTSCRNTTSFKPCRKNARDDKILCKIVKRNSCKHHIGTRVRPLRLNITAVIRRETKKAN